MERRHSSWAPTRWVALAVVLALVAAACGRADDGTREATEATSETTTADGDPVRGPLAAGEFGDLGVVCSPGDPEPVQGQVGITGTTIHVAVFHDAGFAARPGLLKEFQDIGQAFTAWCNEHGGVRGYRIEMSDRDVAFSEHLNRMIESCESDFAMVGGGAALDDAGQETRLACGLPDFAGFVVTQPAAGADLVVQALPNPIEEQAVAHLRYADEHFPEATGAVGILAGDFGTTRQQAVRVRDAMDQLGWNVVSEELYPPAGVDDWSPFVAALQDAGVRGVYWIGEPENLAAVRKTMRDRGYEPDFVLTDANHYDQLYLDAGGDAVGRTFVQVGFVPFELADQYPAIAQYTALIDDYDPDGKKALLGAQGLSAWLLFATSLGRCIDEGELTRDCVYQEAKSVTEWTGGGLHAPRDVAHNRAGECQLVVEATPDGFVVADVEANQGPFTCSPDNVLPVTADLSEFGEPARCPSGVEEPLPSECPA